MGRAVEGKILHQAEDKEAKELRRKIQTNRTLKLEMREKGHVTSVQRGLNPEQDQLEKQLVRITTKGVVKLFNAIYQAQRQHQRAGTNKEKLQSAKDNLMEQLQGAARNVSKLEVGNMDESSSILVPAIFLAPKPEN